MDEKKVTLGSQCYQVGVRPLKEAGFRCVKRNITPATDGASQLSEFWMTNFANPLHSVLSSCLAEEQGGGGDIFQKNRLI